MNPVDHVRAFLRSKSLIHFADFFLSLTVVVTINTLVKLQLSRDTLHKAKRPVLLLLVVLVCSVVRKRPRNRCVVESGGVDLESITGAISYRSCDWRIYLWMGRSEIITVLRQVSLSVYPTKGTGLQSIGQRLHEMISKFQRLLFLNLHRRHYFVTENRLGQ